MHTQQDDEVGKKDARRWRNKYNGIYGFFFFVYIFAIYLKKTTTREGLTTKLSHIQRTPQKKKFICIECCALPIPLAYLHAAYLFVCQMCVPRGGIIIFFGLLLS